MAAQRNNGAKPAKDVTRDHAEQYPTDKRSLFDMWDSEKTVDPIPVEDLTIEQRDEKAPTKTKDDSSSEKKYKP